MEAQLGDAKPGDALVRIGELARRLEVSPELLRAWERRYGLLKPKRTAGGFRLYSNADETRVRAMQAHIERGLSAAEAAEAALSEIAPQPELPAPEAPTGFEDQRRALLDRLSAYDESGAQAAIDHLLATYSRDTVLEEVILPLMRQVGDAWVRGTIDVGQEHFSSHVIRGRLMALARGWDQGTGPRAVLACAPGEQHDLGLLCHGLALRARGWRISYLGADTPIPTIAETVGALAPHVVVLAAQMAGRFGAHAEELASLVAAANVVIGGSGVDEALADQLGVAYLGGNPVTAAEALTAQIFA